MQQRETNKNPLLNIPDGSAVRTVDGTVRGVAARITPHYVYIRTADGTIVRRARIRVERDEEPTKP